MDIWEYWSSWRRRSRQSSLWRGMTHKFLHEAFDAISKMYFFIGNIFFCVEKLHFFCKYYLNSWEYLKFSKNNLFCNNTTLLDLYYIYKIILTHFLIQIPHCAVVIYKLYSQIVINIMQTELYILGILNSVVGIEIFPGRRNSISGDCPVLQSWVRTLNTENERRK